MNRRHTFEELGVLAALGILLATVFFISDTYGHLDFSRLAVAVSHGRLYIDAHTIGNGVFGVNDLALYGGRYFLPFGPLPALLLVPVSSFIQLIGYTQLQAALHFSAICISAVLIYRMARQKQLEKLQAYWIVLAILFGSTYAGIAFFSLNSYVNQSVAFMFGLAALYEYFTKQRLLVVGFLVGLAGLARIPAFFLAVFFMIDLLVLRKGSWKKDVLMLLTGAGACALFILYYNYIRFGLPFETGFTFQKTALVFYATRVQYGMFSVYALLRDGYYALFGLPELVYGSDGSLIYPYIKARSVGISIFFTTPFVFFLFFIKKWSARLIIAISVMAMIALFVLALFLDGAHQYGFRFFIDFFPLLVLLLVDQTAAGNLKISPAFKAVVLVSVVVNTYIAINGLFIAIM